MESLLQKTKEGKKTVARWCALVTGEGLGPRLVYRKLQTDKKPKGVLALVGAWVTLEGGETNFQIRPCHQLNPSKRSKLFVFEAESLEVRQAWVEALTACNGVNMPIELDPLCTVDYDAPSKSQDELVADLLAMALQLGIDTLLGKPAAELENFFRACQRGMKANPFHCFAHVADVTQMCYFILRSTGLASLLSPMQLVGLFLACPMHDLDHRGHTITFERATRSDIGRRYPEQPLEEHHKQQALQLVESSKVLSELSPEAQSAAQECIATCILHTDMSAHSAILEQFKAAEYELLGETQASADFFNHREKGLMLLGMIIKACDISNQTRPEAVAAEWNERVHQEFKAEGAADRKAGRPVLPLHDPRMGSEKQIAADTVGFIDFAVAPVFEEIERFAVAAAQGRDAPGIRPSGLKPILENM
jgi:hypothetical protein